MDQVKRLEQQIEKLREAMSNIVLLLQDANQSTNPTFRCQMIRQTLAIAKRHERDTSK